jgi:rhodanese-related sulfurtransferase
MAKKKKTTTSASNKTRQVSGQPAQKRPAQSQFKSKAAQRAAKRQTMTRTWLGIGGVALVALIIFVVIRLQSQNNLPAEITIQEAYQKYERGAFLLDVREQDEWDEYHIPNTTLIPLGQLKDRVDELPRDQEVVVVCRSGNRSQEGRDILLEAGLKDVTSMAGGVNDWRQAGYPIEAATP